MRLDKEKATALNIFLRKKVALENFTFLRSPRSRGVRNCNFHLKTMFESNNKFENPMHFFRHFFGKMFRFFAFVGSYNIMKTRYSHVKVHGYIQRLDSSQGQNLQIKNFTLNALTISYYSYTKQAYILLACNCITI